MRWRNAGRSFNEVDEFTDQLAQVALVGLDLSDPPAIFASKPQWSGTPHLGLFQAGVWPRVMHDAVADSEGCLCSVQQGDASVLQMRLVCERSLARRDHRSTELAGIPLLHAVADARDQVLTWKEIGQLLNTSPEAAARRYRPNK